VWLPWGLFGLAVAMHVTDVVLGLRGGLGWRSAAWFPAMAGFAGVGALIAARTSNRFGWLFLAFGFSLLLGVVLSDYAARPGAAPLPGAAWVAWTFTIVLQSGFPLFTLALLVFPSGRLPSRGWRPVAAAVIVAGALTMVLAAVSNLNFSNNFRDLTDPVTLVRAAPLRGAFNFLEGIPIFALGGWVVSLVVRLVRSRGEERLQLKWFAYASAVAATAIAIATNTMAQPSAVFQIFAPLIPIGAGVAILKYHLYDIDIVIRRTVVFALLATFITAVYAVVVAGIGGLVGGRSPVLAFAAAVVVAVAFQPARDRARRLADRFVYGRRATPYEVLTAFSERAAQSGSTNEVLPTMARMLTEATGARGVTVWLHVGASFVPSASWPADDALPPLAASTDGALPSLPGGDAFPVVHGADILGAIVVQASPSEPLTPAKRRLVLHVASQAGLVLHNAALVEDVKASRQRIVVAQDEQRRRIERSLREGADRQLLALQHDLAAAAAAAAAESAPQAAQAVAGLREDTRAALENLRRLVRGVYPPLLTERGPAAALAAQAAHSTVPVLVVAEGSARYATQVEAGVYFCALEAIQNALKYAEASNIRVRVSASDDRLAFDVVDDGRGFDPSATGYGTGLRGMADRLAAVGGEVEVRSAPGEGTTVAGTVRSRGRELVRA
jgi:signal transduction histidine kinase